MEEIIDEEREIRKRIGNIDTIQEFAKCHNKL